jgi:polyphosphate kinase 2 (PPK2 family)
MDYRKRFVVEPGAKVRLGKIAPAFKDKHESHKAATPQINKHVERMAKLQYLLYADGNQSLLVVLQALDAGGKDGVVRHVFSLWLQAAQQVRSRPRLPVARPPACAGQRRSRDLQPFAL